MNDYITATFRVSQSIGLYIWFHSRQIDNDTAIHESGMSTGLTQEGVSCILINAIIEDVWLVAWRTPSQSNGASNMRHGGPWAVRHCIRCFIDLSTEGDTFVEEVPCDFKGRWEYSV
jgi:hypothetical protein